MSINAPWFKQRKELHAAQQPYKLGVTVRSVATGKVVLTRTWVNDLLASERTTFDRHHAPGTVQNLPGKLAIDEFGETPGGNRYWFRGFDNGQSPYYGREPRRSWATSR